MEYTKKGYLYYIDFTNNNNIIEQFYEKYKSEIYDEDNENILDDILQMQFKLTGFYYADTSFSEFKNEKGSIKQLHLSNVKVDNRPTIEEGGVFSHSEKNNTIYVNFNTTIDNNSICLLDVSASNIDSLSELFPDTINCTEVSDHLLIRKNMSFEKKTLDINTIHIPDNFEFDDIKYNLKQPFDFLLVGRNYYQVNHNQFKNNQYMQYLSDIRFIKAIYNGKTCYFTLLTKKDDIHDFVEYEDMYVWKQLGNNDIYLYFDVNHGWVIGFCLFVNNLFFPIKNKVLYTAEYYLPSILYLFYNNFHKENVFINSGQNIINIAVKVPILVTTKRPAPQPNPIAIIKKR